MTATRASTDSDKTRVPLGETRPRIGLLGIMQGLYDDMLPGIAERQAAYARELADALADVADVVVAPPSKDREDAERAMRELESSDLDGLLVVMLTYGPAMRVARLLASTEPADLPRQRAAGAGGDGRLGHGGPDVQPGHPRRAGHGQRDGAGGPARSTSSPTTGAPTRSATRSGAGRGRRPR